MHSLTIKKGNITDCKYYKYLKAINTKEGEEFKVVQEDTTRNNGIKFREGKLTLNISFS